MWTGWNPAHTLQVGVAATEQGAGERVQMRALASLTEH